MYKNFVLIYKDSEDKVSFDASSAEEGGPNPPDT